MKHALLVDQKAEIHVGILHSPLGAPISLFHLWVYLDITLPLLCNAFSTVAWTVHHDQYQWHDGEPLSDADRDFGRFIYQTTSDHSIELNLFLSLLFFAGLNDHILHHLFPTIDRSRFDEIRTIFQNTCLEFGMELVDKTFYELLVGCMRRLILHTKENK
eukprot:TRINITY_DN3684_c0_g1_i2.p1 TRINITY_DN3684_c0_g1~~TRINITY_DN3684_c0_g1_i2.p1  ORF type:complete len:160 (-),score=36.03 TRINITY_DN3684_c0_g1_i2:64-543(-)